jgi:hypothetical protein
MGRVLAHFNKFAQGFQALGEWNVAQLAVRGSIPQTALIAGMRSQNSDASRYFASREQLRCELGEGERIVGAILSRTVSGGKPAT